MTDIPPHLTEERAFKIRQLAANRQLDLTVVLEDVHDPHNIAAVMRTCDAVGIAEVHVILTRKGAIEKLDIGKRASAGARKWVDVILYNRSEDCFNALKKNGYKIYGTHLAQDSASLYNLNMNDKVALAFGNEHAGLSDEALKHLTGNFIIPQFGMVQSLNVSVACAISCYEALRQRIATHKYGNIDLTNDQKVLYDKYVERQLSRTKANININKK